MVSCACLLPQLTILNQKQHNEAKLNKLVVVIKWIKRSMGNEDPYNEGNRRINNQSPAHQALEGRETWMIESYEQGEIAKTIQQKQNGQQARGPTMTKCLKKSVNSCKESEYYNAPLDGTCINWNV
jgi:hypothetical protein